MVSVTTPRTPRALPMTGVMSALPVNHRVGGSLENLMLKISSCVNNRRCLWGKLLSSMIRYRLNGTIIEYNQWKLNKIGQRLRKFHLFEIWQSPEGDSQNGGKLWTTLHMFCTCMNFFVFPLVLWLRQFPSLKSRYDKQECILHGISWSRAMETHKSDKNFKKNEILCTKWKERCSQLSP